MSPEQASYAAERLLARRERRAAKRGMNLRFSVEDHARVADVFADFPKTRGVDLIEAYLLPLEMMMGMKPDA